MELGEPVIVEICQSTFDGNYNCFFSLEKWDCPWDYQMKVQLSLVLWRTLRPKLVELRRENLPN